MSDFQLSDGNGGIVHVARSGGAQRVLWQGGRFDNPLGIAVVVNHPPRAALTATPGVVPADAPVSFDASGSTDPEGRPLRYDWDLDGDGVFEARSVSPTVTRRYQRSAPLTVRVRVTDRHGSTAQATAPLSVDATAPGVARFRASSRTLLGRPRRSGSSGAGAATAARPPRRITFRYRLSERARMAVGIAQARPGRRVSGRCRPARPGGGSRRAPCTRWQRRITLRQLGACRSEQAALPGPGAGAPAAGGSLPGDGGRRRPGGQPLGPGPDPPTRGRAGAHDRLGSRPWRPFARPRSSARSWTGPSA